MKAIPKEVDRLLEVFFSAYTQSWDDRTKSAYWLALCDVGQQYVAPALMMAMRLDREFRPTPGEVRSLAWKQYNQEQRKAKRLTIAKERKHMAQLRIMREEGAPIEAIMEFNGKQKALSAPEKD